MPIDEKLPHKEPVKFIKEVEAEGENHAVSIVEFKQKPTLSAVVEAAAQNIVFITSIFKGTYKGVLTGMKNIELLGEIESGLYRVHTEKKAELDDFFILEFEMLKGGEVVVRGEINIYRESK